MDIKFKVIRYDISNNIFEVASNKGEKQAVNLSQIINVALAGYEIVNVKIRPSYIVIGNKKIKINVDDNTRQRIIEYNLKLKTEMESMSALEQAIANTQSAIDNREKNNTEPSDRKRTKINGRRKPSNLDRSTEAFLDLQEISRNKEAGYYDRTYNSIEDMQLGFSMY